MSRGTRKIIVQRVGFKRSHLLRVGDTRYPGNDEVGQADSTVCGVWVGFAWAASEHPEPGEFVRLTNGFTVRPTCPSCRASQHKRE